MWESAGGIRARWKGVGIGATQYVTADSGALTEKEKGKNKKRVHRNKDVWT